jgi:hypothetical protein
MHPPFAFMQCIFARFFTYRLYGGSHSSFTVVSPALEASNAVAGTPRIFQGIYQKN